MRTCADCSHYRYCRILERAIELNCYEKVCLTRCNRFIEKKIEELDIIRRETKEKK
jgi:hypothetical protein